MWCSRVRRCTGLSFLLCCWAYGAPVAAQAVVFWQEGFAGGRPAGWSISNGVWEFGGGRAETARDRDPPEIADSRLTTSTVSIPPAHQSPRLRLRHWFQYDDRAGNDRGFVEISVEGAAWRRISASLAESSSENKGWGEKFITYAVRVLGVLFLGTAGTLDCEKTADTDDDGALNVTDVVFLLRFLFQGGSLPPLPIGECGTDPTPDPVSCWVSTCV